MNRVDRYSYTARDAASLEFDLAGIGLKPAAVAECFEHLDSLRRDGVMNMFGASTVLQWRFGLEEQVARKVLVAWMQTFSEFETVDERVAAAFKQA